MDHDNQLRPQNAQEKAIQRKVEQGRPLNAQDRHVIQAKMSKALQRTGAPLPAGARIDSVTSAGGPDAIIEALNSLGQSLAGQRGGVHAIDFFERGISSDIRGAFGSNNLSTETFRIAEDQDQGFNTRWLGSVRLNVTNQRPVGGQQGGQSQGGTSGSNQGQGSASDTHTQGGTGGASVTPGDSGGAGASAEVRQEHQRQQGRQDTTGGGRSTQVTGDTNQQMYEADIVADISLRFELRNDGVSDWFKALCYAGDAISPPAPGSRSVSGLGTVRYTMATSLRAPSGGH